MQFARSLPVALLGLVLGLVLVPAIIQLSKRAGWYDVPDVRKWHRDPIPATGGIAIMVSLFAALLIAGNGRSFIMHHAIEVLGMAVLAFIGVFDDRKGVAPNVRFVVELLLAALVAANGTRITDMGGFLGMHALPVLPQYVLTVLVIVGLTNAFNLVDGIDGLAGSLAISTGAVLVGAALLNGRTDLLPLLLALSGAAAAFLVYNWNPARIFMGDGGSLPIGFVLAVCGVSLVNEAALTDKHLSATTAVVAAAFIGIVVDTLRVFLGRVGRGRSPFSPDRTHLHHWFLRNLHTPKAAVRSMLLAQALTVVLSLLLVDVVGLTLLIVVQVVVQWLLITSLRTRWCFRRSYRMVRGIERMSA